MEIDINKMYDELIENVKKYHPSNDYTQLKKAFDLAVKAHENQYRKSGEPYIIHPIAVAIILSELELDFESIIAGLLHDVIEDTTYGYDDLAKAFSPEIANIVEGVTKLTNLNYTSKEDEQAENYRKMFLAMSTDIRVIIVKISDRLHNMRTLEHMKREKQIEKATETRDIYIPLAQRLGIARVKDELENLVFKYLNPKEYEELNSLIENRIIAKTQEVNQIVSEINFCLDEAGIRGDVAGRPKHLYSIYRKMINKNKSIDQIYDLSAVRVLVENIADCYAVLGILHEKYKPIYGRFKDYIAVPKVNMYQSLHNTLMGPNGDPFEVQIKTYEMHKVAEYGIAAHWKYKQGKGGQVEKANEEAKLNWLKQILDWQREYKDNSEYLDLIKGDLNLFEDRVYCFTPQGKIVDLPKGSTPIDFAYFIHSAIGNRMVGARVNNAMSKLDYKLKNGDIVEIITSQNSNGPSRDWLKIVKSTQAKSKINAWFKTANKEANIARGRELLEKEAKRKNYSFNELMNLKDLDAVLNKFSFRNWDAIYSAVGYSGLKEGQVINRLIDQYKKEHGEEVVTQQNEIELIKTQIEERERKLENKKDQLRKIKDLSKYADIKGLGLTSVRYGKCCTPVPGDEILAFVTRGRGATIHRTDCVNILNLDSFERSRVIDAEWPQGIEAKKDVKFSVTICIEANNKPGVLFGVSKVLNEEGVDIENLNTQNSDIYAVLNITLKVQSKEQLDRLTNKLLSSEYVYNVKRVTT